MHFFLRYMHRLTALESARAITILVIVAVLILPVYSYIHSQGTQQVSQTIRNVYSGTETVQVTGSIPNEMDTDQFGFFGAIFWNPTSLVYRITRVEFNASNAIKQVLGGVQQGMGRSYPTLGWRLDGGGKVVYLTTAVIVLPHTAQEFFIRIGGNGALEAFPMTVRIAANGTVYQRSYQTRQASVRATLSVLWLGTGPIPQFIVPALYGQETIFYVSLQEDANYVPIGSNGKLTIQLPSEFTNIQDIGGAGWAPATIAGNKIEVNNTVPVRKSYITYAFKARAPIYKGLYMLNASFIGTPNERPTGNFCVRITDS
jgi:hypothetical protein